MVACLGKVLQINGDEYQYTGVDLMAQEARATRSLNKGCYFKQSGNTYRYGGIVIFFVSADDKEQ